MSDIDLDYEIDKLKREAVMLLDQMFQVPKGFKCTGTERVVECIISATLLEMAKLNKEVKGE